MENGEYIPEEALEQMRDPEVIKRQVAEGKSFQEILGYTDAAMEAFYTAGRNLFLKQEYKKSGRHIYFFDDSKSIRTQLLARTWDGRAA